MSSDSGDNAQLTEAIRALGVAFINRLPAALADMRQELSSITNDAGDQKAWKNLHRHLHSIAGAAGTFGYTELGDRARELEHRVNAMQADGSTLVESVRSALLHDQNSFMEWVQAGFVKQ